MNNSIEIKKISEIATVSPKRTIPKGKEAPFVEMAALQSFKRDVSLKDITRKTYTGSGSRFQNGDTLLARITPCLENGKTALISNLRDNECGFGSTEFIVLSAINNNDKDYLYYLIRSEEFRNYAISRMEGTSGRQRVPTSAVENYTFKCPDKMTRKNVGTFLKKMDDLILLLQETNQTLEAITQTLFKSWFMDFEPVKAKADGKKPEGISKELADLFPDGFEDSELGKIPKGWCVESVYKISELIYGAPFTSSLFNSDGLGLPLVRIRDLKDENPVVFTPEKHPKGYLIQPGDIAVGMDGEFRAYLWGGPEAWLNQRVCVFKPKQDISAAFVRSSIIPRLAEIEATETATTVIHLGKNDIDRFRIVLPSSNILEKFNEIADPLYQKIVKNKQQIRTLSELRDNLLPRLISGKINIPDIEEQVA